MHKQWHQRTNPNYTYRKGNVFYFRRKIPSDLRCHYNRPVFVQSLRTTSPKSAERAATVLSARLDEQWLILRLKHNLTPASNLLVKAQGTSELPLLSEMLETYLTTKGRGKADLFFVNARRNIGYVLSAIGDQSIDLYSKTDAVSFRDWLVNKGLQSSSIHRVFSSVRAIINFSINEFGYSFSNPFAGVYIANDEEHEKRRSLTPSELQILSLSCREEDDELRHLLALLVNTGMRLSEATGLHTSDMFTNEEFPYVKVQANNARRLKTSNSKRIIPLTGVSLWAANRIKKQREGYCFPRYTTDGKCNSNSASAALGKWLKNQCETGATIHGIRHAFRDRLRTIEAPVDLIDQLGGWSSKSVGFGYGDGYAISTAHKYLDRMSSELEKDCITSS